MGKKYKDNELDGCYIATESFNSDKIISSGKDVIDVYKEALKKGVQEPVINYVQQKDVVYIY